jgi:hypothetical protein
MVVERQRLAAAEERYARACRAMAQVEGAVAAAKRAFGDLGLTVDQPVQPLEATSTAVDRAAEATEKAAQESARAYDEALAGARSRAMTGAIAADHKPKVKDTAAKERAQRIAADSERKAARAAAVAEQRAEQQRKAVERVIARLPADVVDEVVARVERAAEAALTADPGASQAAMNRLRGEVQQAQDADRFRRARLAELLDLRDQLSGLGGDAVAEAHARLDGVDLSGPLPADLRDRVAGAAAAAQAERDRGFVVDAVAAAFEELGYVVGEGFSTAVAAEGAVMQLPWSTGHGVRVRARDGHMLFNVVRYDDGDDSGDAVADTQVEGRFCDSYGRLREAVRRHGAELDIDDPDPPGHRPLQRIVAPVAAGAAAEAEAIESAQRERKRP